MVSPKSQWSNLLSGKKSNDGAHQEQHDLHQASGNLADQQLRLTITDEEWTNASRAFRTASWGAAFYLVRHKIHDVCAILLTLG